MLEYVLPFPNLIQQIACPVFPAPPGLPEYATNKLCDFCMTLVKSFSSYYKSVKILVCFYFSVFSLSSVSVTDFSFFLVKQKADNEEEAKVMFARLYFCATLQTVLDNALDILTMKPPQRM